MHDSGPQPDEPGQPLPDADTVAAAVAVLQTELSRASSDGESIDRKAIFLPTLLVGLAALLLLPSGTDYTRLQLALIGAALVTGTIAGILSFLTMSPGQVSIGPNADELAQTTRVPVAAFNQGTANALARSINQQTRANVTKGRRLRPALGLAAATMLILVLARIAGGLP